LCTNRKFVHGGLSEAMTERIRRKGSSSGALVPAEGNFEEHPYFRVGDRNAGTGILRYENELRTKDGNVLKQSWTVMAAHGRGLPGRFDQDVYVALLQMLDEKGLPEDGWLSFSLYELVHLMGRSHSGRDYRQVRESLQRLATTSIESHNAFYHRGRKTYISDTFSLLTEVKLSEYEDEAGERTDRNRVHLSKHFVDSYKANYVKGIDLRFYWSLSSPIAKRLYRLIDKKRNGRRVWEAELFSLKDRIPLSDYKYASKIKEKLSPAHAELMSKDFLEEIRYHKRDGREYAEYRIQDSFHGRRSAVSREHKTSDEFFCIQRLKAEGMGAETAEEVVSRFGTARVMHYVEALPFQKNIRNPAGWLRKAIQNAYELDLPPATPPTKLHNTPGGEDPSSTPGENNGGQLFLVEDEGERSSEEAGAVPVEDPGAARAWGVLLDRLYSETEASYAANWFDGMVATSFHSDVLCVRTPGAIARNYVEDRFGPALRDLLAEEFGPAASLRFSFPDPD
jgi:hypothetical protein